MYHKIIDAMINFDVELTKKYCRLQNNNKIIPSQYIYRLSMIIEYSKFGLDRVIPFGDKKALRKRFDYRLSELIWEYGRKYYKDSEIEKILENVNYLQMIIHKHIFIDEGTNIQEYYERLVLLLKDGRIDYNENIYDSSNKYEEVMEFHQLNDQCIGEVIEEVKRIVQSIDE